MSLSLRLSRSFSTTSLSPPPRKGRIPRVNPKTQSLLPPEKWRAIISLYHQSEDLITMENLEQRIDAAFSNPKRLASSIPQSVLDGVVKEYRTTQRFSPWSSDPSEHVSGQKLLWSSSIAKREKQIIDALCGTETIGFNALTLPGYGTLMEARKGKQEKPDGEVV